MSTVNVNRVVDASGGVLAPISSVMRNRIINGGMTINQRGIGTVTLNGNLYGVDRWGTQASQNSKLTMAQTTGAPTGFNNSLNITSLSAYTPTSSDYFWLYQGIEGFNIADFGWGSAAAKSVTLSFWVYASLTGTYSVALNNGSRSYVSTYTVNVANTWEQKTITIAGDTAGTWNTTNSNGVFVQFDLGCGSTRTTATTNAWQAGDFQKASGTVSLVSNNAASFNITGVQLERGTQATSFEYRQYQQELALCKRYLPSKKGTSQVGVGTAYNTGNALLSITFDVEARTAPTGMTVSASSDFTMTSGASAGAGGTLALSGTGNGVNGAEVNIAYVVAFTTGNAVILRGNTANALMLFNGCEL
jgi:hypothetical protein